MRGYLSSETQQVFKSTVSNMDRRSRLQPPSPCSKFEPLTKSLFLHLGLGVEYYTDEISIDFS